MRRDGGDSRNNAPSSAMRNRPDPPALRQALICSECSAAVIKTPVHTISKRSLIVDASRIRKHLKSVVITPLKAIMWSLRVKHSSGQLVLSGLDPKTSLDALREQIQARTSVPKHEQRRSPSRPTLAPALLVSPPNHANSFRN